MRRRSTSCGGRSTSACSSSTPPTSTARARARRSSPKPSFPYPDDVLIATKGGFVPGLVDRVRRSRRAGDRSAAPARRPTGAASPRVRRRACAGSASTASSSTSCTCPIRTCPSRTRSARWWSCATKASSATSVCRTSTASTSRPRWPSRRSRRSRIATTRPIAAPSASLEMCEEHGIAFLPWGPISVDATPSAMIASRHAGDDAAGGTRVVARALAGHAPDPGHVVGRAPRRERGRRRPRR